MANKLYPLGKQAMLSPGIDLIAANVKAMILTINSANGAGNFYAQSDAHQYLSDVVAASRLTAGVALTTKTVTALAAGVPVAGAVASPAGTFNADTVTFPAVTSTYQAGAVLLYIDTGTESTSRLIGYFDTVTGFPFTPSGADAQVLWDTGANKIFGL